MNLFPSSDERLDEINENLRLIQRKNGLTFGTDAYLLAAFARRSKAAAELGGGTGVVSLLMASSKKCRQIYTAEIQNVYAELIRRNAELNGLSDVITSLERDVREIGVGDVGGKEIDCVVSNPPYLPASCGRENLHDEMNIARRETAGTIYDFCAAAARLLKHGGYFTVVYRPDRLAELISAMRKYSLEPKRLITVYPGVDSRPCLVLVEAKKGAAPSMVFAPPLIIYGADGKTYTEKMQRIYDEFSLEHLF